jgi:hypothetical protein
VRGVNYVGAFIAVAPDTSADHGTVPPARPKPTAAQRQFEMLHTNPYRFTSEEILFASSSEGIRLAEGIEDEEKQRNLRAFFEKPRACLRSSPLAKQYGWGFHFDADGRVALYGVESEDYRRLRNDGSLRQLEALRSKRG